MNKIITLVVVTVVAILFVMPSVIATPLFSLDKNDVQLYIKGGIGIHMRVTKPDNINLTGNYTIYGQGILLKGKVYNENGSFILPESIIEFEICRTIGCVFLPITVTLNAGGKSLSKSGFIFMWITILS